MHYLFCVLMVLTPSAVADIALARQAELLNMLKHDCGSCHGLPPKGGLGPSLMPDALAAKTDALLFDAIQNGRAGSAMPAWRPFLNAEETHWMIQQLRQP